MSAPLDRQSSAAFTEPEDGFADDDLLAPDDLSGETLTASIFAHRFSMFLLLCYSILSLFFNPFYYSVVFCRIMCFPFKQNKRLTMS